MSNFLTYSRSTYQDLSIYIYIDHVILSILYDMTFDR